MACPFVSQNIRRDNTKLQTVHAQQVFLLHGRQLIYQDAMETPFGSQEISIESLFENGLLSKLTITHPRQLNSINLP